MSARMPLGTFLLAAIAGAALPAAGSDVQYIITDLGTPGEERSWPYALNNAGQVLGLVWPAGSQPWESQHFLWDPATGMRNLDALLPGSVEVTGLNDAGQLVFYYAAGTVPAGFLWNVTDPPEYLGEFSPSGVNNAGRVVGGVGGARPHTVVWDRAAGVRDIGLLSGGDWAADIAINDVGQVVGGANTNQEAIGHPYPHSLRTPSVQHHAYLWDEADGMRDLGTLGGDFAWGTGVNDLGQVVGLSYTGNQAEYHAFLWDEAGGMQDLGTLPGGQWSEAKAINNAGQVVGMSGTAGDPHGFIWDSTNGMRAIEDLLPGDTGWSYFHPADINNAGQILGHRVIMTWVCEPVTGDCWELPKDRVMLLTLIPEPGTVALVLCGSIMLMRRK